MASILTIHPANSKTFNNSGIAVISFDVSCTFTCPNTNLFVVAHALTIWIAL
jgi:hypothetical protein